MTETVGMDLVISVSGEVVDSNFAEYKDLILAKIDSVNLDPETDTELAEAEQTIKVFAAAEKELDAAREKAMNDTAGIRDLFTAMTEVADKLRETRLDLNKKVKAAKEKKKTEIVAGAVRRIEEYIAQLASVYPFIPPGTFHVVAADFHEAGKGKKKIETFKAAVEEAADEKAADFGERAVAYEKNWKYLKGLEQDSLFPDIIILIQKPHEEVVSIADARAAKEKLERIEREKHEAAMRKAAEDRKRREQEYEEQQQQVEQPTITNTDATPMPGAEIDHDAMVKDAAECIAKAEYFTMTVKFGGDVDKVKAIATEVDRIVSKHPEVLDIRLVRDE